LTFSESCLLIELTSLESEMLASAFFLVLYLLSISLILFSY